MQSAFGRWKNRYQNLVEKCGGKRAFGSASRRWEYNINVCIRETVMGCGLASCDSR
jgi:hypothetical protein